MMEKHPDQKYRKVSHSALLVLATSSSRPPECVERLLNSGIGGVRPYSAAVFTEYS